MVAGFKKEENERKKVQDELASVKDEKTIKIGINCTVSSATSTGLGLGLSAGHLPW